MAYTIHYSPKDQKRYPAKKKDRRKTLKILVILIIMLCTMLMGLRGIPDFMIPGDPAVTKAAVKTMIYEMECGTPISDAVTAFCKQILQREAA